MTQHWAFFLILLTWRLTLGQGKDRSWSWSWPSQPLTDEEIVDLLYTDPDRLRALTYDGYDGHYGYDVPQSIDYRPQAQIAESPRLPKVYEGDQTDYSRYPEEQAVGDTAKPQAMSYMKIQQYSPAERSKEVVSYSHLIVH